MKKDHTSNASIIEDTDVLIVGAGPTGLAAALFLNEKGHKPRIIEKRIQRSSFSKAFGVNARTLELLASSGVSNTYLENGRKLECLTLRHKWEPLARLQLSRVNHRYPFMLVQSQADSERILEEELQGRGIRVERGLTAKLISKEGDLGIVDVEGADANFRIRSKVIFVADGAASPIRSLLNISFDGEAYDEPWGLYDVELESNLPKDEASIFLLQEGGVFVVRHHNNLWRILGNVPNLLSRLPEGTRVGRIEWESKFEIANRVASKFQDGPFYLAGDAAHVHAGIGARGMNLGIEDAYVFANLYHSGRLIQYEEVRRSTILKVVGQIRKAMGAPRPKTLPGRVVRLAPWLVPIVISIVGRYAERWILGLDHEIDL